MDKSGPAVERIVAFQSFRFRIYIRIIDKLLERRRVMQTYTIEYAFQDKEQTTRTCEVVLDRTPDLNDNEQLADLYQIVSDAIRKPITTFEIVAVH